MPEKSLSTRLLLIACLCSFLVGGLLIAFISVLATNGQNVEIDRVYQSAFEIGYAEGVQQSPSLEVEQQAIGILSSATFFDSIELELKGVSRQSNAVELTYGEVGRDRFRVPTLGVGEAMAHQFGHTLYVIKHVSVFANLRKATLEVTKVSIPHS